MREAASYRGARRNEARRRGLVWRFLDAVVDGNGSRRIKWPFERLGKKIKEEANGQ
jgi:hypothetical protein